VTVHELIVQLEKMPLDAQVHIEVFDILQHTYGHAIGVSRSEPDVIVISNRKRTP
jgi:hypothetical protein